MRAVSGKEFCKILERHGWSLDRISRSHPIDGRPGSRVKISVPVHGNQTLGKGLQRSLVRDAGLTDADL